MANTPIEHTTQSYPVVTSQGEVPAKVNESIKLTDFFAGIEYPNNSTHQIDHYTAFVVQGSGSIVVGSQSYALGSFATEISPSEFANASFQTGASAGTSEIAVVAFDDAGTPSVAGDTILNVIGTPDPISATASIEASVNSDVQLSPYFNIPPTPAGLSISLVNFINTHSGPGELTSAGSPTSGNVAIAFGNVDQVGFATGSVTGSDQIEVSVVYSDGSTSNPVDLTVNIQSSTPPPPPPPQNDSGPVIDTNVQPFQVTVGQTGTLTSLNLSASDAAYSDPSLITYNITNYPLEGVIYDNGQLAHSFTQADINAGHVTYQSYMQNGVSSEITDSLTYFVSDPSGREPCPHLSPCTSSRCHRRQQLKSHMSTSIPSKPLMKEDRLLFLAIVML